LVSAGKGRNSLRLALESVIHGEIKTQPPGSIGKGRAQEAAAWQEKPAQEEAKFFGPTLLHLAGPESAAGSGPNPGLGEP